MYVSDTALAGVKIITPTIHADERGDFVETFALARYRQALGLPELCFVQDNVSRSRHGVLRGLHFQRRHPQGKLVSCTGGEFFDVVVDIRPHSPTYGHWLGTYLSATNRKQLWIPPGLAHGFLVTGHYADCHYKCTDYYHPEDQGCLRWDDDAVGIVWPLAAPQLSARDHAGLSLSALGPGAAGAHGK